MPKVDLKKPNEKTWEIAQSFGDELMRDEQHVSPCPTVRISLCSSADLSLGLTAFAAHPLDRIFQLKCRRRA